MKLCTRVLLAAALCAPSPILFAQGFNMSAPSAPERAVEVTAIPGVIAAGAQWELIWRDTRTADGIVSTPDGGVIFAQEQTDTIRKLDSKNRESVYITDTHGTGAVSVDAQGRLFAVERTCTDPGKHMPDCAEPTKVALLKPSRKVLAEKQSDGKSLGRVNDVVADGKGGAYFTSTGLYHVSASGKVSTVAEEKELHTNGVILSADGKTLFTTNGGSVIAFDVKADGSTANRRDFGTLDGDTGGDGMAIDNSGRLYVTASKGVHVLGKDGKHIGLIPTPRVPISLTFSGPHKKTLYVASMGANGTNGKPWNVPQGVRNTAMTMYRIPVLTQGFAGRPK